MELDEEKLDCARALYNKVVIEARVRTRANILNLEATETALSVIFRSLEPEWEGKFEISTELDNLNSLLTLLYTSIGEERGGKQSGNPRV